MDIRQLFAANLRRIRHEKGLSQEELAYEADVDRAHVSKIERSLTYVGLEIVEKFARKLGVPPDAFLKPLSRTSDKKPTEKPSGRRFKR
ncbi:helix-turn-helix domain-containing protein [Afipia sp. DC4300-2b1]|uniref:helix-turn-helix domain-containing protein n=1 Tax=Afipia sp. DC4300-2b1 TaxID=2804672 RepID=UPI003CEA4391